MRLEEPVTIGCRQPEAIEILQLINSLPAFLAKRELSVKGVQNDTFKQITKGHVLILSEPFKHLEEALLDTNACLHSLNLDAGGRRNLFVLVLVGFHWLPHV